MATTVNTPPIILYSKPITQVIQFQLAAQMLTLKKQARLDIVLVGNDPASQLYVKNKLRFAQSIAAYANIHHIDPNISASNFKQTLDQLANNPDVNGILIQLPLPAHLKTLDVSTLVPWEKDVDGLHPYNLGRLIQNRPYFVPCTAKGIIRLMEYYNISIKGKLIVVIGRSLLVGRPLAAMLTNLHGTVILAHSRTSDLASMTKQADIIVIAIGKAKFLTKEYIGDNKPWVIDVGINKDESGSGSSICGDADFTNLLPLVSGITPVPGGIGPMTVAGLGENLWMAAKSQS